MKIKLDTKIKFLIAGGSNTAITFALYALLVHKGVDYNLSLALTYAIGIVLGFLINRMWTFASHENISEQDLVRTSQKSTRKQFGRYVLSYLLIFLVNFLSLNLLVQAFKLNPIVAQLFAIAVSTVCSYFLQKSWVFNQKNG